MHNFRCSQPHPVLVPVATEMTSSWQPASNCFSSALPGSWLPPQGFPADPSELDQCNLKCEGFKSRWGEHLTSEKDRIVNKDLLLFKPMGCSGRSQFLSNQVPEQKLHLTAFSDSLSLLFCFTLLVSHFSSLRVKSLIREELTIFALDSCSRKCKLKYPEKINKFQTGNHKYKNKSSESTEFNMAGQRVWGQKRPKRNYFWSQVR